MIDVLRSALLPDQSGLTHAFLGRRGGVSTDVYASLNCGPGSGDDPGAVAENRARATTVVGAQALNTLYQIHSGEAVTVTASWTRETAPKADGMATRTRGLALGVLAADCAPVLLADAAAGVIGACHAGWKGALGGIVEATVTAMEGLGAVRGRIAAAVGPCISQDNYEVGPEFFDVFVAGDPQFEHFFRPSDRLKYWRFDLPAFVAWRLGQAGIAAVDPLDVCTYAGEETYFSYRRTTHRGEPDYGRNLSLIVLP